MYRSTDENFHAIFAPLVVPSFVLDDFLADHGKSGADQITVSSASTKTGAGTALCTSRRRSRRARVVGMTDRRRVCCTGMS
jgi:hypothetical protein